MEEVSADYLTRHTVALAAARPGPRRDAFWNEANLVQNSSIPLVEFDNSVTIKGEPAFVAEQQMKQDTVGAQTSEATITLADVATAREAKPFSGWEGVQLHVLAGAGELSVRSACASGHSLQVLREYESSAFETPVRFAWEPVEARPNADAVDDTPGKPTPEDLLKDPAAAQHREVHTLLKMSRSGQPDEYALAIVNTADVTAQHPVINTRIIPIENPGWVSGKPDTTRKVVYSTSRRQALIDMLLAKVQTNR